MNEQLRTRQVSLLYHYFRWYLYDHLTMGVFEKEGIEIYFFHSQAFVQHLSHTYDRFASCIACTPPIPWNFIYHLPLDGNVFRIHSVIANSRMSR